MSSSSAFRHVRHLSIPAIAAANESAANSITRAKFTQKMRTTNDPDKVLEIYASVSNLETSPLFSCYAQDMAVKRLAKARRFDHIETLIDSKKNNPKIKDEAFITTLIRSYGIAGMFDHAFKMFNQMDELGTPRTIMSFNAVLLACNNSKLFGKVPQLFDEMPQKYGIIPDKVSYGLLIKSYCQLDKPELAIERLKEMEDKGVEVTVVTYTTILYCLHQKGRVEKAEKFWNEMVSKGCVPDVAAYNVRLMYCLDGKPEVLEKMIEEMIHAGLKPDTISYTYLMTCYCKNGMMDEAKKVYEGLEETGCNPYGATFGTLIFHLCKNEMFDYGFRVFKVSVKENKMPDFCILKPLVVGLAKGSDKKRAKEIIQTAKKKYPSTFLETLNKFEEELGLVSASSVVKQDKQEASE